MKIYDTQTGQRITTLQGHTDLIKEVYWSPDEHHLLTVSADGTARVYDVWRERVNAPVLIAVLQHPVGVATGSFVNLGGESDDDDSSAKFVVTGAKDGGIRVWAIPEDVVVASPGTARYSTATGATGRPHSALGQNLPTLDHNLPIAALMGDAHGPTTTKTLPSVQSVVTDMDGKRMFSGDTEGTIKVWVNEGRGAVPMFRCAQTIAVENGVVRGMCVNERRCVSCVTPVVLTIPLNSY